MSLLINVSPQIEAQIVALAESEGIEPSELIEKLVNGYRPAARRTSDLGGKTLGELYGHLFGTVAFEPTDVGKNAEEYLRTTGFGETIDRRDISA